MKNEFFLFSFTEQFRFEVIFFSFKFQELSIVNLGILYQCNLKDSQKATQDHISPTFQISKKIIWRSVASQQATLSFSPNYSENCGFTTSDTILTNGHKQKLLLAHKREHTGKFYILQVYSKRHSQLRISCGRNQQHRMAAVVALTKPLTILFQSFFNMGHSRPLFRFIFHILVTVDIAQTLLVIGNRKEEGSLLD